MAFQFNNDSFMQSAKLKQDEQQSVFDSISKGIESYQRQREMKNKKEQLANDPEILAETGFMTLASGGQPTPEQANAMKWKDAQNQAKVSVDQYGNRVTNQSYFDLLGAQPEQGAPQGQPPGIPQQQPQAPQQQPQAPGGFNTNQISPPEITNVGDKMQYQNALDMKKQESGAKLAVEKKLNEKFIEDVYIPYTTGGGADAHKQVQQISGVVGDLDAVTNESPGAHKNLTGGIAGYTPKIMRGLFNEPSVNAQEKVESVVQRDLKAVLGGSFSEREGEALIARAYNPRLSEAANSKRLVALQNAMEGAAKAKESAIKYFDENGTISGWGGTLPTFDSISKDFDKSIGTKKARSKTFSGMTKEQRRAKYMKAKGL